MDTTEERVYENKKSALIKMYFIFLKYSDEDHILRHSDIADILDKEYNIKLERKAIARNIALLQDAGIKLVTRHLGAYLDERPLEDSELRMLIDGVLSSKYITPKYSHDLINKLASMGNVYFKSHVKNIYTVDEWNKSENVMFFLNIDVIDDAIEKKKQISFDYNKYGVDKKLHVTTTNIVSPYQFILHNQCYYLMAYNEKWEQMAYYRVDHITNVKIKTRTPRTELRDIPGFENGIDYKKLSTTPYMYTDEAKRIEFKADKKIVNQVVEWFGADAEITELEDCVKVVVYTSLQAMEYWSMQYLNYVEVVYPLELRNNIKNNLEKALIKYKE